MGYLMFAEYRWRVGESFDQLIQGIDIVHGVVISQYAKDHDQDIGKPCSRKRVTSGKSICAKVTQPERMQDINNVSIGRGLRPAYHRSCERTIASILYVTRVGWDLVERSDVIYPA